MAASTEALLAELREKIRETRSRVRVSPPPVPNQGDFTAHRMSSNAAKPPKGLDPEQRAGWEYRRLADAYRRSRQARSRARTEKTRWQILADLDGWTRVAVYLSTLVYRLRNDRQKAAQPQPDTEALAAALAAYVRRHLGKFLHHPEEHRDRLRGFHDFAFIQPERVAALADFVARGSARDWDPNWYERKRQEGRKSTSRGRPGTGLFAAIEARTRLLELLAAGRPTMEIATEFGVDRKTIQRAVSGLEQVPEPALTETGESTGAPSWWGAWERDDGIVPHRTQRRRKVFYPGER